MKEKNFEPLDKFTDKMCIRMPLTEEHKANINVSENNGFYLYNYNQNVLVPRGDPIIRYCRGLVLNGDGMIINMPFKRFFNAHEAECDEIDWGSAEILEKLDGSMISVWWTGSEWEVTTRGSFYPNEHAHNFKETFMRLFTKFDKLQPGHSYMFEMISKDNRIVTRYDDEFVCLIGCRSTEALCEFDQDQLDMIARNIDVRRPKRFKATNVDECRNLFENMEDDEEGLVIVDKDFNRMKLKQESYLKMSKIMQLKEQDILDYIAGRTEIDGDYMDMPEVKEKIKNINDIYRVVFDHVWDVYINIKDIETQKEFASHALNYRCSSVLFKMRNKNTAASVTTAIIELKTNWKRMKDIYDSLITPKDKQLIVLRGIPGAGKSTWIKENNLGMYVLCADDLRLMYSTPNPYISQEWNGFVWGTLYAMLGTRMKEGSFIIIDAVHQTNKSLKQYRKMCEEHGYDMKIIDFKISLEDALERNRTREEYKKVPEAVIERMHTQITETFINEENNKIL